MSRRFRFLGPLDRVGVLRRRNELPLGDRAPGARFYLRVMRYFRPDRGRIAVLVALIWVALAAGVLEGAVVAVLTDAVLSDHPPAAPTSRWLLELLGSDVSRATRILQLAAAWFIFRAIIDVAQLLREMINNRLKYNGTARVRTELFDHLQQLSP